LPLSEIANARKLGTAASMASCTDGSSGMARSFVVRIVEGLAVAPGRDDDAAIIFMSDLWSAPATPLHQRMTVIGCALAPLTKGLWE
jgi:hypothetical protein